ncbi:MAG: SDR family NAD(P)-dependent oxidoreductase, partial [Proteobacteria bacterium]|nr:SDR family NAD(P)-dependent oxidoreductase [Pseudomonadota bacterium]
AFTVAQEASKRMIPAKQGSIFFTGATASIKGFPGSSIFAMGKFAIRGLAQSLYRELSPLGIHVAHFVIDGAIDTAFIKENFPDIYALKEKDGILQPDAIADAYWFVHTQHKSAWTHELDLRPYMEKF